MEFLHTSARTPIFWCFELFDVCTPEAHGTQLLCLKKDCNTNSITLKLKDAKGWGGVGECYSILPPPQSLFLVTWPALFFLPNAKLFFTPAKKKKKSTTEQEYDKRGTDKKTKTKKEREGEKKKLPAHFTHPNFFPLWAETKILNHDSNLQTFIYTSPAPLPLISPKSPTCATHLFWCWESQGMRWIKRCPADHAR